VVEKLRRTSVNGFTLWKPITPNSNKLYLIDKLLRQYNNTKGNDLNVAKTPLTSIPRQSLWDLWWHWDRFFSGDIGFPQSASQII
jgi:hypothetical protein